MIVESSIKVDDALRIRLKNIFQNPVKKILLFSGGKESLVLAHAITQMIHNGEIQPDNFEVYFVDEEAIFDCVERIVMYWREVFLSLNVPFHWLCLQFRHFNCFNRLTQDESFITWDEKARDVWVRQKPSFAVVEHPNLKMGMSYQEFFESFKDCVQIVGLRALESVQRRNILYSKNNGLYGNKVYPIYDWNLNDVWLYLYKNKIQFPDAYFYMWKCGVSFGKLRISQFFSVDTAIVLVELIKYYPGLYERILRREPNAKLIMLYYNTYMFRRSTNKRKKLEGDVDYKAKLYELMRNPINVDRQLINKVERLIVNYGVNMDNKIYRDVYNMLLAGDPKHRRYRAIIFYIVHNRRYGK